MEHTNGLGKLVAMKACGDCANKTAIAGGYAPWILLRVILMENRCFSFSERTKAKLLVAEILEKKDMVTFVERLLLHRQRDGQLDCPASFFLDPYNALGFNRSAAWMRDLEAMREKMPSWNIQTRALAEALVEIAADASRKTFRYWQYYFNERDQQESLSLFTKAAGYLVYGID